MEVKFLLLIYSLLCFLQFCQSSHVLAAIAIKEYIKDHFVKNSIKFDFIIDSDNVDFLELALKEVKELDLYGIIKIKESKNLMKLERSAIFILGSFESYQRIDDRLDFVNDGSKQIELLIFCQDLTTSLLTNPRNMPNDPFQVRCFLMIEKGEVFLNSLELFTPFNCKKLQLVTINSFSRKSMKWKTKNFFDMKIRNFYGCELVFGVRQHMMPSSDYLIVGEKLYMKGFNFKLVFELNKILNYDVLFKDARIDGSSILFPHKTTDLVLTSSFIDSQTFQSFAVSLLFIDSYLVIVIPPGEAYSDFEKLFLPFDSLVWIFFTSTFLIAFIITIMIKYFSTMRVQNLVFGSNVLSPALNIVVAFMGGGQITLPTKSFARFLLMIFILFSLIMR